MSWRWGVPTHNGTRYALGNLGHINTPLDDPTALVASLGLGVGSVMLAKAAGRHLALSERSVFGEPDAPRLDAGNELPPGRSTRTAAT